MSSAPLLITLLSPFPLRPWNGSRETAYGQSKSLVKKRSLFPGLFLFLPILDMDRLKSLHFLLYSFINQDTSHSLGFKYSVSRPGWPQTHYLSKDELKLLIPVSTTRY